MNKSLQINSDKSIAYRNKSLHTVKELKSLAKDIISKRPQDLAYNSIFRSLDDSELMLRHRCNFVNSKLKADKQKFPSLVPDRTTTAQVPSNDLIDTLGAPKPETIFRLSTNIEELKKQMETSQLELIQLSEVSTHTLPAGRRRIDKSKPVTRKDVGLLEEWLDFMLSEISNYPEKVFENAQIVYSAAFQEISNQVKFHCLDRGNLLDRAWKAYFSLMISAIKHYQGNSLSLKIQTSTHSKLLESKYKQTINNLQSELNESTSQLSQLKYNVDSLSKQLEKYKFHDKLQQNKFNLILRKYQIDKKKLLRLEDTNQNLKHLVGTVLDDIESDMPGLKKMKGKNIIRFRNLSEILISDPLLAAKRDSIELNFSAQEIETVVEQQRADLENKIFLQEIKEQMMDNEDEIEEIGVNTDILYYAEKESQTIFDDFLEPVVDVETDESKAKPHEFQDYLTQVLKNEELPNDGRLNAYFNLDDLIDASDNEKVEDELPVIKSLNFDLISPEVNSQVNSALESVHISYKEALRRQKRKSNYYKIKRSMCIEKLKELRIMLFAVVNENLELKQKIRKGGILGSRKIVRKPGTRKKLTISKEFNFGKIKKVEQEIENPPDQNQSSVNSIVKLVVSGEYEERLTISKRGLMKVLNGFIHELISQPQEIIRSIQSPILSFFSYVTSKFTIKTLAKANFAQYILALKTYKQSSKTFKIMSRMFGLFEGLDTEYFITYVELFKLLFNSSATNQIITDSNEEVLVSLNKCEEASDCYWKGKILDHEMHELKKNLQKSAVVCPKNQNRSGVVNQIDFLELNLRVYVQYLEHSKHQVKDLFDAVDLGSDGFLDLEEFKLIFRNLDKKNNTEFYTHLLFSSYSDIVAENNGMQYPAISYSRFATMSAEKGLFNNDAQKILIGVDNEEDLKLGLDELLRNIEKILKNIEWKLEKLGESKGFLKDKLEQLKENLLKGNRKRHVLMAYRLFDLDTKERLIGREIGKFLPGITDFYEKIQKLLSVDRSPPKRDKKNLAILEENDEGDLF